MSSAILGIVDAITAALVALTPSTEPDHPWTPADGRQSLEDAPMQQGRPLRSFAVDALLDAAHLSWNGDLARGTQTIRVQARYLVPDSLGGWQRAARLGAADCAQLMHAIARPGLSAPGLIQIIPSPAQIDLARREDTYYAQLLFDATYFETGA